jgi:tetratricopeptide (TPR) repeat protein
MKTTHVLRSAAWVLIGVALMPGGLVAQVHHTQTFSRSDLSISSVRAPNGKVYARLTMLSVQLTAEVGSPELPVKYVNLILPSDKKIRGLSIPRVEEEVLAGFYEVYPTQPPEPTEDILQARQFADPDPEVYSRSTAYPAQCAAAVHDGYFDGCNHIVTVAFYPVRYNPQARTLTFVSKASITIDMGEGPTETIRAKERSPKAQQIYDAILKQLVANPNDIPVYGVKPALSKTSLDELPYHEYLVITSAALAPSFNDFVAWKKRKGLDIGVVTTEEIYANYSGDRVSGIYDNAGKVRECLREAYRDGSCVWALLAGDETIVPVRHGAGYNNCDWGPLSEYRIPADLYYADFNGDWEVDGDELYGEPTNDSPDYNPEIFVGRLPCANSSDVANWTERVLAYETDPGRGDYSYLTRSFWVEGDSIDHHPSATSPHYPSTLVHTIWDQNPPHKGSEVVSEMSSHYGILNWYCHGNESGFRVKQRPNGHVWAEDDRCLIPNNCSDEPGDGLDNMTNANYYSVAYSICCDVAAFEWPHYQGRRCVGEAYVCRFPRNCGPALLANTRYGLDGPSQALHMCFADLLTLGAQDPESGESYFHLGVSELVSKLNYNNHYLRYSHNLFGCPETQVWVSTPSQFTSVSITDGGSYVTVNAGAAGCDITASSGNNGSSYWLTAHNVSTYTFSTSIRPLYITITRQGYIPYTALTGGTFTTAESWFGNLNVLGNITVTSSGSLTVLPGCTVRFSPSKFLTANGRVVASGSSTTRIKFTCPSGTWFGILVYGTGGNNSRFEYVDIDKVSSTGGQALHINGANAAIVKYCSISNNNGIVTSGLAFSWAGSPEVAYNTINSNSNLGVSFYSTNGNLYANAIKYNSTTGVLLCNASPGFGKVGFPAYYGNNTIKGGTYGISASSNSYPYVGSCYNSYYGYNDISENSLKRVTAASGSDVFAEKNWWGTSNPTANLFQADASSTIEWGCYLTYDPTPLQKNTPSSSPNLLASTLGDTLGALLRAGVEHRIVGRYSDAKALLKQVVNLAPASREATQALFNLLYIYRETKESEISDFCQSVQNEPGSGNPNYSLIVAEIFWLQGRIQDAAALYSSIAEKDAEPDFGKRSLLALFHLCFQNREFEDQAKGILDTLLARYATDALVMQASWMYQMKMNSVPAQPSSPTQQSHEEIAIMQNYPNPFNPATTISYQIPRANHISLKIFDVLGREVATLVDEIQEPGYKSVYWDASAVASGVYFYRLQVGDFVQTRKLLVLR